MTAFEIVVPAAVGDIAVTVHDDGHVFVVAANEHISPDAVGVAYTPAGIRDLVNALERAASAAMPAYLRQHPTRRKPIIPPPTPCATDPEES
jgi:hypothetical protein